MLQSKAYYSLERIINYSSNYQWPFSDQQLYATFIPRRIDLIRLQAGGIQSTAFIPFVTFVSYVRLLLPLYCIWSLQLCCNNLGFSCLLTCFLLASLLIYAYLGLRYHPQLVNINGGEAQVGPCYI